jgi:hypothetical protein
MSTRLILLNKNNDEDSETIDLEIEEEGCNNVKAK